MTATPPVGHPQMKQIHADDRRDVPNLRPSVPSVDLLDLSPVAFHGVSHAARVREKRGGSK